MSDDRDVEEHEEDASPKVGGSAEFPDPPDWEYKRKPEHQTTSPQSGRSYSGFATGFKYAYLVVGPMIGGWIIGKWIGSRTGNTDSEMWGLILGVGFGLGTLVLVTNRTPNG